MFRALLQALEPQQRFAAAARLTQDVLTAVVDEVMPLTRPVRSRGPVCYLVGSYLVVVSPTTTTTTPALFKCKWDAVVPVAPPFIPPPLPPRPLCFPTSCVVCMVCVLLNNRTAPWTPW